MFLPTGTSLFLSVYMRPLFYVATLVRNIKYIKLMIICWFSDATVLEQNRILGIALFQLTIL